MGPDSNSRARALERLEDGIRLAKGGLPEKAIEVFREVRALSDDPAVAAESLRRESHAQQALTAWDAALAAARSSAKLALELERRDLLAEALNAEAAVHYSRGTFDEAIPLFEAMLTLTDEPRVRGLALQNLGITHGRRGELDRADERLTEALAEFERADYEWGQAHVLNNRVGVALEREEYPRAVELAEAAVARARAVDDLDLLAVATLNHAEALTGMGDLDRAEEEASTALGYFESAGNVWRRIGCFQLLGKINQRLGDLALARLFWTKALDLATRLGATAEIDALEAALASLPPHGDGS